VELAKGNAEFSRVLEAKLDVQKPIDLQVSDVELAIGHATDFDDRQLNYNFDYDYQAYEDVKKGLKKLIVLGHLEEVKSLALRLMKDGSYQVECSDEGLMTDDIQDCLKPVMQAMKAESGAAASKWALEMLRADRVGFICENELKRLSEQS